MGEVYWVVFTCAEFVVGVWGQILPPVMGPDFDRFSKLDNKSLACNLLKTLTFFALIECPEGVGAEAVSRSAGGMDRMNSTNACPRRGIGGVDRPSVKGAVTGWNFRKFCRADIVFPAVWTMSNRGRGKGCSQC